MSSRSLLIISGAILATLLVLQALAGGTDSRIAAEGQRRDPPLPSQIIVDSRNPAWLVYNRDADRDGRLDPFFMCGPGGPEGFLYGDTSGGDDPDAILDKITRHGGNCIYMIAVRSHGGDGKPAHNPFINHDPARELDPAVLDRWERWFRRMEQHGIVIYFFFYDDSVKLWNGNEISPEERRFIHGIVNRFEHYPNLIWCIAEEYSEALSPEKIRRLAAEIRAADDHDHVIATHQQAGHRFDFPDDEELDQFAMQIGARSAAEVHTACLQAREYARGRYSVFMAELHPYHSDLLANGDRDGVRQANWAAAMAGCYAMHLGPWETGVGRRPSTTQMLQDYRRLHRFMESLPNLTSMAPMDRMVRSGQGWALGTQGHYLVYLPEGGRVALELPGAGRDLQASWYSPRDGSTRKAASAAAAGTFEAPDAGDWLVHLTSERSANVPPEGE